MFMTRRLLILSIVIILAVALAACGGEDTPTPTPPATPASAPAATAEAVVAAVSPLAAPDAPMSPLAAPVSPLAQPARPALVSDDSLLFFGDRGGQSAWFVADTDGQNVRPFVVEMPPGLRMSALGWSPKRKQFLARLANDRDESDWYLVNLDGSIAVRLTNDPYEESDFTYSPQNDLFVYICFYNDLDICTADPATGKSVVLTGSKARDANPQWSPDGSQILFTTTASGIPNIWVMNADGSNQRSLSEVTMGSNLFEEGEASWSPDGQQILFVSKRSGVPNLFVMAPDGTGLKNLSQSDAIASAPLWSSDGKQIAYLSNSEGHVDIVVVDAASGDAVNLTETLEASVNGFAWSPDGASLVFGAEAAGKFDIYSVSSTGGAITEITQSDGNSFAPQWVAP